ncbi:Disease resistance protein (CC-NBS-LRR class) family [Rhynchospora pubera]|uniref:Disease resistance protein (CC-NBS-LRR class) family n=1 Tax=Rhynchospora pubera TaxID=906938 RepID=A0AAV8CKN1_9POAL|nr:Disease resistance protein (CC-NBS-LRR class) family [Rhynchospora pubera]
MALISGVISNLLSLGATWFRRHLVPALSDEVESHQIETELKGFMRMLEQIKSTLYDAETREIRDLSVKLWLTELKRVAYDAEDVLDEYRYEVLRAQVEARDASSPDSRKRKLIRVPDGMLHQIRQIRSKFSEIVKARITLRLTEEDGPWHCNSDQQIPPTTHLVVDSDIIGREMEKKDLIDVLSSANHDGKIISVVTIVGTGGIGKTTLAKLVYNDQRYQQKFDKFVWVCVSQDFNVQRLTREVLESITGESCGLTNLSALQERMKEEISNKRVFLVLDDVWNENRILWELFQAPFKSASLMNTLVTTRNEPVARIMQTVPTFYISYMSEEQSWQLFQHYAFGEATQNMSLNFVEIGKQIMKKCGLLPLAIKSIASLLRHEPKEESWREILESELWESGASNALQISYARLPTYLKPCFLYCSMFPRDYCYNAEKLVKLWISQGYVQTNGLKNAEKIGLKYAKQLSQRSFFQGQYILDERMENFMFTLHDMIHDLAQFNSGHACYSIEGAMVPKFPAKLYHLSVNRWVKPEETPPPCKFATLRSLIIIGNWVNSLSAFDFSKAQNLRTLRLRLGHADLESHFSFANLKHLRHLSIGDGYSKRLPECICSLYNLQYLDLKDCSMIELPECIGNLVSLEELTIEDCSDLEVLPVSLCQLKALRNLNLKSLFGLKELPPDIGNLVSLEKLISFRCQKLRVLPVSLCQLKFLQELNVECSKLEKLPPDMGNLTNLQLLYISSENISSLPPSLNKIIRIPTELRMELGCRRIGWLKDFVDLEGKLELLKLCHVGCLEDVHCANLASMHNLQHLTLSWTDDDFDCEYYEEKEVRLSINSDGAASCEFDHCSLMDMLQPHPNLKELKICSYGSLTFPDWFGNPTICRSLETITLYGCKSITFLPLGRLEKLKHLHISKCSSLQFIEEQSLPLALEQIKIDDCESLIAVTGIRRLKSLVKFHIADCRNLHWLDFCGDTVVSRCPKVREYRPIFELLYYDYSCLHQDIDYKEWL